VAKRIGRVMVVLMSVALAPVVASAQDRPSGFVGAAGGLTFGTVTSAAVAGQGGAEIAPGLYVIGEVGYMRNVLPKDIRDGIDDITDLLAVELGLPVEIEVSVPMTYGFGGLRWSPDRGTGSPFVEGGIGFGHVKLQLDRVEVLGVDAGGLVEDQLDDEDTNATKFLLALGGGVTLRATARTAIDLGYRYTRIATEEPTINSSMVYGAVKVGF
jgi:hypothetical protein